MMVRSLQQLNTPRNEKAHLDQAKFPSPCSSSFTIAADAEVVLGKAETRFSVHFLSRFFSCGTHNYIMQQLRSHTDINFLCFCKARTYCSLYSTSIVSFSSRLLDKNTKISHVPNRSKLSINRVLEKQDLFTHFDV